LVREQFRLEDTPQHDEEFQLCPPKPAVWRDRFQSYRSFFLRSVTDGLKLFRAKTGPQVSRKRISAGARIRLSFKFPTANPFGIYLAAWIHENI